MNLSGVNIHIYMCALNISYKQTHNTFRLPEKGAKCR